MENRLRGTRTAGGPDGIIGTNWEPWSAEISWLISGPQGPHMDPLSDPRSDSL